MGIAIQANRFARVCLEESIKYAHKRKTFGKKLIDHPVIRNKIANMAHKVEATHAWMESLLHQTQAMPLEMAMMKLGGPIALLKAQSGQVFEFCAREAAQIFGGLAYTCVFLFHLILGMLVKPLFFSRGGQGEKVERLYREVRAFAIPGTFPPCLLTVVIKRLTDPFSLRRRQRGNHAGSRRSSSHEGCSDLWSQDLKTANVFFLFSVISFCFLRRMAANT